MNNRDRRERKVDAIAADQPLHDDAAEGGERQSADPGAMLGDAILVPVSEVGSLAVGIGWLSACAAYLARWRVRRARESAAMAWLGAAVSAAIILMKVLPPVPGSFTKAEWLAFALWSGAGMVFWVGRRRNN